MLTRISAALDRVIGITNLPASLVERIRAEQMRSIIRLTPMMMAGNVLSAIILMATIWHSPNLPYVGMLAVLLLLVAAAGVRAWHKARQLPPRRRASGAAVSRATRHAMLLGSIWGIMAMLTYVGGTPTQQIIITTMIAGIGTAGAFTLAPMPQSALAFLIPIYVGAAVSLLAVAGLAEGMLAVLDVIFLGVILVACRAHAWVFVAHLCSEHNAVEQQSVIGMLLKSFEDNASDWLWQLDAKGRFVHVSDRFRAVIGNHFEHLEGVSAMALLRSFQSAGFGYQDLMSAFRERSAFRDIEIPVGDTGAPRWWRMTGEPAFDDLGHFAGFRGVCSDVTEAKNAARRVSYLAHFDSLTGALNRARFNEILARKTKQHTRLAEPFSLAYLDLDGFKAVNDNIGHKAGDSLLVQVVQRLQAALPPSGVLARLGGDEFAILIEDNPDVVALEAFAKGIIADISQPYQIDGHLVCIGVSIGIAIAQPGQQAECADPEEMLHNADLALHHAKQSGRGTHRFYSLEMDRELSEARALEADLALAIARNQFELHFQPFVLTDTARISGFEALVRWRHPERGLIPPLSFIPLAEKSGLICDIGLWVLNEACRAACTWPNHLSVAVNLSSRQLRVATFVSDVQDALFSSGLAPHRLELEITESILIERPEAVIETLKDLKTLGVRIAMDDFGTGYSSLSYLWRFPFDKIKIDGSFVAAITRDEGARQILKTISSLANSMGLSITAERVETAEEHAFLRGIRCDFLQGYHFSRPLPESDIPAYLMNALKLDLGAGIQRMALSDTVEIPTLDQISASQVA